MCISSCNKQRVNLLKEFLVLTMTVKNQRRNTHIVRSFKFILKVGVQGCERNTRVKRKI
jgi:hypothetical protein